jgi:hypothetical protein
MPPRITKSCTGDLLSRPGGHAPDRSARRRG